MTSMRPYPVRRATRRCCPGSPMMKRWLISHRIAAVHVNDAEALLEAVIAGLGRSLLPCVIADDDARLRRIGGTRRAPALSRELWLLRRSERSTLGRIEAV